MESGAIKDDQLDPSTDEGNRYKARLNTEGEYWDAGSGDSISDLGQITVDLLQEMTITRVATRVKENNGVYSMGFKVKHSIDGTLFSFITYSDGADLVSNTFFFLFFFFLSFFFFFLFFDCRVILKVLSADTFHLNNLKGGYAYFNVYIFHF